MTTATWARARCKGITAPKTITAAHDKPPTARGIAGQRRRSISTAAAADASIGTIGSKKRTFCRSAYQSTASIAATPRMPESAVSHQQHGRQRHQEQPAELMSPGPQSVRAALSPARGTNTPPRHSTSAVSCSPVRWRRLAADEPREKGIDRVAAVIRRPRTTCQRRGVRQPPRSLRRAT